MATGTEWYATRSIADAPKPPLEDDDRSQHETPAYDLGVKQRDVGQYNG